MTDPADIARGLTEAQRAAVLSLPLTGGYLWRGDIVIRKPTANVLSRLGIFSGHRDFWREFTPLGLAVRQHLEGSQS